MYVITCLTVRTSHWSLGASLDHRSFRIFPSPRTSSGGLLTSLGSGHGSWEGPEAQDLLGLVLWTSRWSGWTSWEALEDYPRDPWTSWEILVFSQGGLGGPLGCSPGSGRHKWYQSILTAGRSLIEWSLGKISKYVLLSKRNKLFFPCLSHLSILIIFFASHLTLFSSYLFACLNVLQS